MNVVLGLYAGRYNKNGYYSFLNSQSEFQIDHIWLLNSTTIIDPTLWTIQGGKSCIYIGPPNGHIELDKKTPDQYLKWIKQMQGGQVNANKL